MQIRTLLLALSLSIASLSPALPQGTGRPVENPDDIVTKIVERIEQRDAEGIARLIVLNMGLDANNEQAENQIRQITFLGTPLLFDRVNDQTVGQSLRQVIYYIPFRNDRKQMKFTFFNFVFMRANDGWYFTHFQFQVDATHLIPPGWITTSTNVQPAGPERSAPASAR